MKFDFETMLERHGMDAIAVDGIGSPGAPAAPKDGFSAISRKPRFLLPRFITYGILSL